MAKAALFNSEGARSGEIELKPEIFEAEPNVSLMHQKVVLERNALRQGTSDTKGRSEVSGGGRKPYRQKGTGRARQGSIVAPHYKGGGVPFGPTPRDYTQKMPRKMRKAALISALSAKAASGDVLVIDEFKLGKISTREAALLLDKMEVTGKALLILAQPDEVVYKSVRNIPRVNVRVAGDMSTMDVINGGQIVITKDALSKMEEGQA